ncbi:MAG: hypothetical protein PHD13_01520 [Methanocellales archaeon]|nr:hypothetical protein [Methanocellales archaeon]MDD3290957.1 hypothetical protein [Methanocellales archaeon]MDD5234842.1 hypothetical protein [Methanocellales archaeon]MDD5484788.1 hypothetical protein [Methanocellales archaeon]
MTMLITTGGIVFHIVSKSTPEPYAVQSKNHIWRSVRDQIWLPEVTQKLK